MRYFISILSAQHSTLTWWSPVIILLVHCFSSRRTNVTFHFIIAYETLENTYLSMCALGCNKCGQFWCPLLPDEFVHSSNLTGIKITSAFTVHANSLMNNTVRLILQIGSTQIESVSLFSIIFIRNKPKSRSSSSTTKFNAIYMPIDSLIVLTVILFTTVRISLPLCVCVYVCRNIFRHFGCLHKWRHDFPDFLTHQHALNFWAVLDLWMKAAKQTFLEFIKSIKYSTLDST